MGIKYIKQKHSPNLYERANARGETVNLGDRAQAAADYLAEKQWGQPNIPRVEQGNYYTANRNTRQNHYNLDNISLAELKRTVKRMKKHKATGPDEIPMEYLMWLDDEALKEIQEVINVWWNEGNFPEDKLKANIASIYKKGNPKMQENYRPISLYLMPYTKFMPPSCKKG